MRRSATVITRLGIASRTAEHVAAKACSVSAALPKLFLRGLSVFLALTVIGAAERAAADNLLGTSSRGTNPSSVFTVNENTGVATLVGPSLLGDRLSGIDVDPLTGTVYAMKGSACTGALLVTIASDGSATDVGIVTGPLFDGTNRGRCFGGSDSLAFAPDGTLFVGGWNGGTTVGGKLLRVDKNTGAVLAQVEVETGAHLAGLAFNPITGDLWVSRGGNGSGRIHTINIATGEFTSTLLLSDEFAIVSDLAFAPDGTLFASLPRRNRLVTINTSTGVITRNVSFGPAVSRMSGLAFGQLDLPVFLVIASIEKDTPDIEALADDLGVDPADLVNEDVADVGVRDVFPIPVGTTLTLGTGAVGGEGWFALKTILASWDAAGPTGDGLRNFVGLSPDVGPGLGAGNDPEALLDMIPDVTPLRTAGLGLLVDTTVCALAYKGSISIGYDPLSGNLKGANRGLIAFDVLSVGLPDGSVLPEVTVEIVDAEETCKRELTLLDDAQAPPPISSSEPSP